MEFTHLQILQYKFSNVLLSTHKIEENKENRRKSNKYIYKISTRDINIAFAKHLLFYLILSLKYSLD